MFKRRHPLPMHKRAGGLFWPRIGWRRSGAYVAHRLRRLPGTPYRIAAGFACGAAISFTPFIGLHFVLAALLALLVRGNLIAAAIGTVVGNPWTFPLIWLWIYSFGTWIMGGHGLTELPDDLSFHHFVESPLKVFLPMVVGGVPTAIVAWFVFFWPLQSTVAEYQKARRRRLRKRLRKLSHRGEETPKQKEKDVVLAETRQYERRQ